ncbi:unnamed protein product, partial [Rangifer tarandus platyrhynchus]
RSSGAAGKRPRSQPPETLPPPPHLVEEPGRRLGGGGWGGERPGWGRKGGGPKAGACRGAGCCGERDDEASAAARSVHPHGIGARGPWARSPETEVTCRKGGGPTEEAAEAAGR